MSSDAFILTLNLTTSAPSYNVPGLTTIFTSASECRNLWILPLPDSLPYRVYNSLVPFFSVPFFVCRPTIFSTPFESSVNLWHSRLFTVRESVLRIYYGQCYGNPLCVEWQQHYKMGRVLLLKVIRPTIY
jgi:hypothetical protein